MKNFIYIALVFFSFSAAAQQSQESYQVYHPESDAKAEVKTSVAKAEKEGKHVLLMIGGNWCRWCKMFDRMLKEHASADSALNANFVMQHVNFSKENRNVELMEQLDFPQRFGFPVFVVLDAKGKRIHTQNSAYLEQGEGYDEKKVIEFFEQWAPAALKADQYK
jgi:thioredoxin-related protein